MLVVNILLIYPLVPKKPLKIHAFKQTNPRWQRWWFIFFSVDPDSCRAPLPFFFWPPLLETAWNHRFWTIIGYTKILCLLCIGDLHVGQVSWICGAHLSQRLTWPQGNNTREEGSCKQTQHICKEGISTLLAPLARNSSTCWSFTSTTSCPPSPFVGSTTKRLLRVPSSKVLTPCKTERGCRVIEPAGLCKIWRQPLT